MGAGGAAFPPSSPPFLLLHWPPLPPRSHSGARTGSAPGTRWERRLGSERDLPPMEDEGAGQERGGMRPCPSGPADAQQMQGKVGGGGSARRVSCLGAGALSWGGGHLHSFCSWKSSALNPGRPCPRPLHSRPLCPQSRVSPSQAPVSLHLNSYSTGQAASRGGGSGPSLHQ